MLDERIINELVERLVDRIEEGNQYILKEIGESIKKLGTLTPTEARKLAQTLKYGGNYSKIRRKIKEITKLNLKEIDNIFKEVAKNDYEFAEKFYKYRNKEYIKWDENQALQSQVKALADITKGQYRNFSNSLAFGYKKKGKIVYNSVGKAYQDAIDKAVLSVAQGKETFDRQMYRTIKELASSGLKTIDFDSGRHIRMDSMVRQNLQGALRDLHNTMQQQFGEEFGADGVEISVHINPAPDHEEVQGRQFSINQYDENGNLIKEGEFEKFQNDKDAVDYMGKEFPAEFKGHDRRSISQYNCYHYIFSIVLGVSKPRYSNEQLQKIIKDNKKGFEYEGKHYTNYEGTQLQRRIETAIRKQKDLQISGVALGDEKMIHESQQKIRILSKKYKELSEVSGLTSKIERARVSNYHRVATPK